MELLNWIVAGFRATGEHGQFELEPQRAVWGWTGSRMIGRPRRKRGFALLDVTVALFVTALLMLACCTMLIGSRRLSEQSQIQAAAYQAARQELETLRSFKFGNRLAATNGSFTIPSDISSQFPNQDMTGTYSISAYGAYTSPPIQQIVVRVSWSRLGVYKATTSEVQLDSLDTQEPGH